MEYCPSRYCEAIGFRSIPAQLRRTAAARLLDGAHEPSWAERVRRCDKQSTPPEVLHPRHATAFNLGRFTLDAAVPAPSWRSRRQHYEGGNNEQPREAYLRPRQLASVADRFLSTAIRNVPSLTPLECPLVQGWPTAPPLVALRLCGDPRVELPAPEVIGRRRVLRREGRGVGTAGGLGPGGASLAREVLGQQRRSECWPRAPGRDTRAALPRAPASAGRRVPPIAEVQQLPPPTAPPSRLGPAPSHAPPRVHSSSAPRQPYERSPV